MPVGTNPKTRESRLFPSMWTYIRRNVSAIFRIYTGYEPLQMFSLLAACWSSPAPWRRGRRSCGTGWSTAAATGTSNRSSSVGCCCWPPCRVFALGVIADLMAANRDVTQRALERVRRIELQLGVPPSHYQPGRRAGAAPARRSRNSRSLTQPGRRPSRHRLGANCDTTVAP